MTTRKNKILKENYKYKILVRNMFTITTTQKKENNNEDKGNVNVNLKPEENTIVKNNETEITKSTSSHFDFLNDEYAELLRILKKGNEEITQVIYSDEKPKIEEKELKTNQEITEKVNQAKEKLHGNKQVVEVAKANTTTIIDSANKSLEEKKNTINRMKDWQKILSDIDYKKPLVLAAVAATLWVFKDNIPGILSSIGGFFKGEAKGDVIINIGKEIGKEIMPEKQLQDGVTKAVSGLATEKVSENMPKIGEKFIGGFGAGLAIGVAIFKVAMKFIRILR